MKAAFKKGRDVWLRDLERRDLRPEEIRLKVAACGICGTDLQERPEETEGPFGHEVAGTVLEVGSAVTGVRPGQKVVLESASACGRCAACRNARQELCTDIQSFWHSKSFGFAEEMIAPGLSAVACEDLEPAVACLAEPLGVAIDLVRLADLQLDSSVLLVGAGPIGLMALAIVRRMGVRRIYCAAYADQTARWRLAERFGADAMIDARTTALEGCRFDPPVDRVLVTSPPATLPGVFQVAAKGAIISFIGIAHGSGAWCTFDANRFHFKKLQLRASFASPALYTPLAVQYLREGVVDGPKLVSHRFPLAEIAQAMQTARDKRNAVKVVVLP